MKFIQYLVGDVITEGHDVVLVVGAGPPHTDGIVKVYTYQRLTGLRKNNVVPLNLQINGPAGGCASRWRLILRL